MKLGYQVEAAITEDGICPLLEFLDGLPKQDKAKAYRLIRHLAQFGTSSRETKRICRQIEGKLWELRPPSGRGSQVRMFYYVHDINNYVVLSAVKKKTDKHKDSDITVAKHIMDKYQEVRPTLVFH